MIHAVQDALYLSGCYYLIITPWLILLFQQFNRSLPRAVPLFALDEMRLTRLSHDIDGEVSPLFVWMVGLAWPLWERRSVTGLEYLYRPKFDQKLLSRLSTQY